MPRRRAPTLSAGLITAWAVLLTLAAAPTRAAEAPESPLAARADRIAHFLQGWKLGRVPNGQCPQFPAVLADPGRIVWNYRYSSARNITLVLFRTRSPAVARENVATVDTPAVLTCARTTTVAAFKRSNPTTAMSLHIEPGTPTWVKPDAEAGMHGATTTVSFPGHPSYGSAVVVTVAFIDKSNPRIVWSLDFVYNGPAPFALFRKILAAAER